MVQPFPDLDALPCEECPRVRLDQHMAHTVQGRVLKRALDLDWARRVGIQLRMSEVSYHEFLILRLLQEERDKFEKEDMERRQREMEDKQRRGR